jgi:hypothetical protein
MLRIGTRITQSMTEKGEKESIRLHKYTEFKNAADVRSHFESTFEDWMSWETTAFIAAPVRVAGTSDTASHCACTTLTTQSTLHAAGARTTSLHRMPRPTKS